MAISAAHGEKKKNEGAPSLSVDDAASTAEAAIAPVEAKSPSDGQIKAAALVSSSSFRAGRGASVLSAASTPAAQAKGAALGTGPSATAASRLPCDDVKPSALTASRAGSGIVPSAAPVCGKSGKTGDVENPNLLGPFIGKVDIEGSRSDPEEAVAQGNHIQNHNSVDDDIMLGFFVDATYDEQTDTGAYSIVFKNFAPGEEDDGKVVKMGWPMDPAVDNNVGEILAVAQATVLAHEALRRWWNTAQVDLAAQTSTFARIALRHALVCIFSDNTTSHRFVADPRGKPATNPDSLRYKLYLRMFEASRELAAIPGLTTELELLWLPSHMAGHEVRMHKQADRHCARVRREGRPICLVEEVEVPLRMEEGLFFELRDTFLKCEVKASKGRGVKRAGEGRRLSFGRLFYEPDDDEDERRPTKKAKVGPLKDKGNGMWW